MVCSITRRPAKPILAPCSATIISPSIPKLAVTPPKVGSVKRFIYNSFSSSSFETAHDVLAICIKLKALSCILAPPDEVIARTGSLSSIAFSIILVTFSPTTLPIEPPIKSKSITATATLFPSISATPVITASLRPVFS